MVHTVIADRRGREPVFELPPRLAARPERRLAWRAARAHVDPGASAFRDTIVSLRFAVSPGAQSGLSPDIMVTAVGPAVIAGLGLRPGPLAGPPDSVAGALQQAMRALRTAAAVRPFEAAVTTPQATCVLLRGILLPVDGGAEAVLSWKQVLDAEATARLHAELRRETRHVAPQRCGVDAFA